MISCQEAIRVLYEYLDGEPCELPEADVRAHFEVCRACFPHLKLEESFRAALRRAARGECAPPDLKDRLLALLSEVEEG